MKNFARNAFNVAACIAGPTAVLATLTLYAMRNTSMMGWAGGGGSPLTALDLISIASGVGVFTMGYTRYIGSGKFTNDLRRIIGTDKQEPPAP